MACTNCRDFEHSTCTDIVPSNCIPWQGAAYEDFEICLGDTLTYIGTFILDTIKDLLEGKGILLPDLTLSDCGYIADILDIDEKNLLNVLTAYKTAICDLKNAVDTQTSIVASFTTIADYTLSCLAPLADPCDGPITFHTLIQAIIDKLCALDTQLGDIAEGILDTVEEIVGNFLVNGAVQSPGANGIVYSGSGASGIVSIEALVPPFAPIVYTGSTGLFDGTGIGLPGTVVQGWFLCNGNNGTPAANTLPQNGGGTTKYIIRFS